MRKGTVDVEDERFYQHNGVDPQGILRAIVSQLSGRSEGASTITQQLVRNTVLSSEQFDLTLKRKVREAYIAIQMEKTYSKDQILNMYLNTSTTARAPTASRPQASRTSTSTRASSPWPRQQRLWASPTRPPTTTRS